MKSLLNTAATVIVVSAISAGTATAMIPMTDLKVNSHPDVGVASQVFYDFDRSTPYLPNLVLGSDRDIEEAGSQELRELVGKYFI